MRIYRKGESIVKEFYRCKFLGSKIPHNVYVFISKSKYVAQLSGIIFTIVCVIVANFVSFTYRILVAVETFKLC